MFIPRNEIKLELAPSVVGHGLQVENSKIKINKINKLNGIERLIKREVDIIIYMRSNRNFLRICFF